MRAGTRSRRTWLFSSIVLLVALLPAIGVTQRPDRAVVPTTLKTQVVMLGTGTPGFDIARSGPATAIVANGTAYLLEVYGPEGIRHMTEHLLQVYSVRRPLSRRGNPDVQVNAHDITPGVVYKDNNVTVTAFPVKHRDNIAYGYRFQTADRSIVISGDTSPAESIVENCNGCDVLIHEAYSMFVYNAAAPENQAAMKALHTSSVELAEIAGRARPGLLILYHRTSLGGAPRGNPEDVLLKEIRALYRGNVVTGHDLDIY